ncbi:rod-binding protein [Phycisphaeraceae bacterium D3-23]
MQVNPHNPSAGNAQQVLNAPGPSGLGEAPTPDAAKPFGEVLSAVSEELKAQAEKKSQEVRDAAEQLVATTFIMPLFSQLRNDPMASDMFHGGRGEAIFQQQLDQILSDRISTGAGFDLVDTVAAHFEGRPSGSTGEVDLLAAARSRVQHEPVVSEGVDLHG